MKEIKLTIDGEEVLPTDGQAKVFGVRSNKRTNPFETVVRFEDYYSVEKNNEIYAYMDTDSSVDNQLYAAVNYFNDKDFAKQVSLHQLLYRKLLKFSYENKCADVEWNGRNDHWCIYYDPDDLKYCVAGFGSHKFDGVYFSSKEGAERAIKEVVEPFVKECPEFVW